jgi:hypothetical protein
MLSASRIISESLLASSFGSISLGSDFFPQLKSHSQFCLSYTYLRVKQVSVISGINLWNGMMEIR